LFAVFVCVPLAAVGQDLSKDSTPYFRVTSELVVVDVVVADGQHKPVHRLAASDFSILENGHPQTIKVFEEHMASAQATLPPLPKFPPGKFTNYSSAPTEGALNILLLDKLNTPMDAQAMVRNQVLKYLKEAPAGTRIAIFGLTTQLRLLQGFTSDPSVLRALVEGKKGLLASSSLRTGSSSGSDNMSADTVDNANNDIFGNTPDAVTVLSNLQQFDADQQSFQLMLRARYTLDAFNQLARYLSNLPGRKNLIWFSGSFPISILPDGDLQNPFAAVATAEDEFRQTINLLSHSQVAVYPIDARELMTDPTLSAANSGRNVVKNPGQAEQKFFQQTNAEHGTMNQMAEATGGKAFVNTNDLASAIGEAIEAGSNYYTLAYSPTNQNQSGIYRKIEVKLNRPGVKLAYRRGYFTDEFSTTKHADQAQDSSANNPIRAAMLHGAPDPMQIVFVADVRPSGKDTEQALAPGNQAGSKTSGPYRRYTVTFALNPKDLNCSTTSDGEHHCAMEFLTFVYDADGALVNMQMNGINTSFSPQHYAAFLKSPLEYRQQISIPVKGNYYLRLGLRDEASDRIGALEMPVAAVAKLPPASAHAPLTGYGSVTAPKATPK
jgi:VWFA-related protein